MTKYSVYSKRIERLQLALSQGGLSGIFIEDPTDLFYFTGIEMSRGHLIVQEKKATLFVDGRYKAVASSESPVPVSDLSDESEISELQGAKEIGFNGNKIRFAEWDRLRKIARKAKAKLSSTPQILETLRLIKDRSEIAKMEKSAAFAYRAFEYAKKRLKVGVTELEIARDLEIFCLKEGASGTSFTPIIAFGKNSALPHHRPSKTKLKANDIALFDLGVILDGYCSDMTRVVFFGKGDQKLRHLFDVCKAAQLAALAKVAPGVTLKELDVAARKVMKQAGLEELFVHNLGHGIGLEVHEFPRISSKIADRNYPLMEGMCITIEPGLYLPGKGGVRYEDTIVVTAKGYTNLYPER